MERVGKPNFVPNLIVVGPLTQVLFLTGRSPSEVERSITVRLAQGYPFLPIKDKQSAP
jgi:hypothetical protein